MNNGRSRVERAMYLALIVLIYVVAVIILLNPLSWDSLNRKTRKHRATAPYHAISLSCESEQCNCSAVVGDSRFLLNEVPELPRSQCMAEVGACRYVHHRDRRDSKDRRVVVADPGEGEGQNRRELRGRRKSDWSLLAVSG